MIWMLFLLLVSFQETPQKPKDLVWKYRILIIQGRNEPKLFEETLKAEIEERKLALFWFSEGKLEKTIYPKRIDEASFLSLIEKKERWILIGLDGGKKAVGVEDPDFETLKKIIDSMPMRRLERSRNG
ncbi:hypothetical protein AO498_13485 [Algoriphagus sanaruensis]|uniref:DUF4174 domain-containing protein n=2 Tax=Algoriphagus sanaruensis TaxID=1727163 RepID=A0A142EQQ0_9BACT|nr:hypothetical protein AO498_13485 [Algoriphagus sanaruensis]